MCVISSAADFIIRSKLCGTREKRTTVEKLSLIPPEWQKGGEPCGFPPLDLAVMDHRLTALYYVVAETSFLSFVNLRWSFMCHSSHATSPSMLPLAPAVNPVAVAATVAFVAGATPVLHEPAITAGAPGNGVATPGPTPAASTAYQNE